VRERTGRQKINGDKCWKTGEREYETKDSYLKRENSKHQARRDKKKNA
jgi:hypothetical protein